MSAEQPTKKVRTAMIADNEEAWTTARMKLLEAEKTAAKAQSELSKARQELPWLPLKNDYIFIDSSNGSSISLSSLFEDDNDELIVYHMMMSDSDKRPCSLCCFFVDQLDSVSIHLPKNVKLVVTAKANQDALADVVKTKQWKVPVLSASSCTFGEDMGVSFTQEQIEAKECPYNYGKTFDWGSQAPGLSVFRRKDGQVYKTYSTFSAGLANISLVHGLLDLTSTGRNEGKPNHNMWWVKHKEDSE